MLYEVKRMNNTVKYISKDKSCRFVIVNGYNLYEQLKNKFDLSMELREYIADLLINSILLSALNNYSEKVSYIFRFSKENVLFCEICNGMLEFSLSKSLCLDNKTIKDIFNSDVLLSVTKGDLKTGIHTSTVMLTDCNPETILKHFASQSEQLDIFFVHNKRKKWFIIVQALPFVEENQLLNLLEELNCSTKFIPTMDWDNYTDLLTKFGDVIETKKFIFCKDEIADNVFKN